MAVQAGVSAYGAYSANKASDKAADQQTEASDKALDFAREVHQQQRADQLPFITTGQNAMTTLGSVMGLGGGSGTGAPPSTTSPGGIPQSGPPGTIAMSSRAPWIPQQPRMVIGEAVPRAAVTTPPVAPSHSARAGGTLADVVAPAQARTASSFARIQAPNGNVYDIPMARVDEALKQGGVRI